MQYTLSETAVLGYAVKFVVYPWYTYTQKDNAVYKYIYSTNPLHLCSTHSHTYINLSIQLCRPRTFARETKPH